LNDCVQTCTTLAICGDVSHAFGDVAVTNSFVEAGNVEIMTALPKV
jgi:hypothetical protein